MESLKIYSPESAIIEFNRMDLELESINREMTKAQQGFQASNTDDEKGYYQKRIGALMLRGAKVVDENNALVMCIKFAGFLSEHGDQIPPN